MEDEAIVELFFARNEEAVTQSRKKYGRRCRAIAQRFLNSREDAEEIESDVLLKAWKTIPPNRPKDLGYYLALITRQLSINRCEKRSAEKRGGQAASAAEELTEAFPDRFEDFCDRIVLKDALDRFLSSLAAQKRRIFVQRYWYACSVHEIAEKNGMSDAAVNMTLVRTREKLKKYLIKEGVFNV